MDSVLLHVPQMNFEKQHEQGLTPNSCRWLFECVNIGEGECPLELLICEEIRYHYLRLDPDTRSDTRRIWGCETNLIMVFWELFLTRIRNTSRETQLSLLSNRGGKY